MTINDEPVELLDRIEPAAGRAVFLPTTVGRLRAASFLDGRTAIATGPQRTAALASLFDGTAARPVRTILHVSFCGSTLLSRLLDVSGKTLALREPRAQVDLADWRAAIGAGDASPEFRRTLRAATASLGRSTAGECVIVKPTNWANILLPDWALTSSSIDPVFLTMAPRLFVAAVFRGGRDRLAFTIRAATHFASVRSEGDALVRAAIAETPDPLDRAARFAALAIGLQRQVFADACAAAGWGEDRVIDFADLRSDPVATAVFVARLLRCPLEEGDIAARAADLTNHNAKAPERAFTLAGERDDDERVRAHHGDRIEAALRWGEREGLLS